MISAIMSDSHDPLLAPSPAPQKPIITPPVFYFFMVNMFLASGPLTLPYAFSQAGLVLGTFFIVIGAFIAYLCATLLIECLAGSNAIKRFKAQADNPETSDRPPDEGSISFDITEKIEIGQMAGMYYNARASQMVYLALVLYLYGTLCVYALTVASSLQQMAPLPHGYDIYLTTFGAIVVPLSFGSFENTKVLQVGVACVRLLAFCCMIAIPAQYITDYSSHGPHEKPIPGPLKLSEIPLVDWSGLSYIFGNAILCYNCHHSLPGLCTPVRPQAALRRVIRHMLIGCSIGVTALCTLGMVAFGNAVDDTCVSKPGPPCTVQKLFNMEFASYHIQVLGKGMDIFPALLVALYPLLSITLRNNLKSLCSGAAMFEGRSDEFQSRLFTVLASVPMICIAYAKPDVQIVTSISGAYCGMAIMYIIPCLLVVRVRRALADLGLGPNPHASEFQSMNWIRAVIGWGSGCALVSTYIFGCKFAGVDPFPTK